MSRNSRYFVVAIALLLSATLTMSVHAKKGGNGGGNGNGGGDPPPDLPNVRYELSQIQFDSDQMYLKGCNNTGTVVGYQSTDLGPRGFIYTHDTGTLYSHGDLDTFALLYEWPVPPGSFIMTIQDVNEFGLAVGVMGFDRLWEAFALDTGNSDNPENWVFTVLPAHEGSTRLNPRMLNDAGDILVQFDYPDETIDNYLYNYYAPAANEPLPLNMFGAHARGINNFREVLLGTGTSFNVPTLFAEGSGLTIFTDADYREPGQRHHLNDAGQFAWKAWMPTKRNKGITVPIRQVGSSVEILQNASSWTNGINQQGDTIIEQSSNSSLHHDDELITIEDLIPDTDPLKTLWVENSSEVYLLTDRSSDSNDPEHLRYPSLFGTVSTSAGHAAIVFTPIPSP